jgi:hypothetical protein
MRLMSKLLTAGFLTAAMMMGNGTRVSATDCTNFYNECDVSGADENGYISYSCGPGVGCYEISQCWYQACGVGQPTNCQSGSSGNFGGGYCSGG